MPQRSVRRAAPASCRERHRQTAAAARAGTGAVRLCPPSRHASGGQDGSAEHGSPAPIPHPVPPGSTRNRALRKDRSCAASLHTDCPGADNLYARPGAAMGRHRIHGQSQPDSHSDRQCAPRRHGHSTHPPSSDRRRFRAQNPHRSYPPRGLYTRQDGAVLPGKFPVPHRASSNGRTFRPNNSILPRYGFPAMPAQGFARHSRPRRRWLRRFRAVRSANGARLCRPVPMW